MDHISLLPFQHNDGGRHNSGFQGRAGDCVARAVTIASGRPYAEVYAALAAGNAGERRSRHTVKRRAHGARTARAGIHVTRKWFRDYMAGLGFRWVPTMSIGQGCTVHLRAGELPARGHLVVSVSKHYCAVVDGILHDTYNCSREGTRCVYGYWQHTD